MKFLDVSGLTLGIWTHPMLFSVKPETLPFSKCASILVLMDLTSE
ncbi:MAG: hypothetical protein WCB90_11755 [Methanosarcina sp.]